MPAATRVAVLVNPANAMRASPHSGELQAAAGAMGLQIGGPQRQHQQRAQRCLRNVGASAPDALFVSSDPFFTSRRVQVILYTTRHAIPATYPNRQYPEVGGLMSYGANIPLHFIRSAAYAGRILAAEPADLPVVQSSKFELVINAETARMLGLTVPPSLLATADEVIE